MFSTSHLQNCNTKNQHQRIIVFTGSPNKYEKKNLLYLAVSPVRKTIITGGGDATLRFWNVLPSLKSQVGICAERGLLGVTTCATMLEERVRSNANHQNQDSLQLVEGTS
ncbi:WD40 repeat protein [Raphanus sativus]|nr:WD40 repeat protein [Raphanus sativus]